MIFLPAIDLIEGRCVRLYRGDYGNVKEYSKNPVEVARQFEAEGAEFIHIVDLDAAREPGKDNLKTIAEIIKSISIPVEVGGGIRDMKRAEKTLSIGVQRIIIGTVFIKNRDESKRIIDRFGERVIVSIDAKNEIVYLSGWTEGGGLNPVELALKAKEMGVKLIIYTDISKDGTLEGPNLDGIKKMAVATGLPVIAAGGISSLEDLQRIKTLERYGVTGVISGKAIYEGRFSVRKAIEILKG